MHRDTLITMISTIGSSGHYLFLPRLHCKISSTPGTLCAVRGNHRVFIRLGGDPGSSGIGAGDPAAMPACATCAAGPVSTMGRMTPPADDADAPAWSIGRLTRCTAVAFGRDPLP